MTQKEWDAIRAISRRFITAMVGKESAQTMTMQLLMRYTKSMSDVDFEQIIECLRSNRRQFQEGTLK